MLHATAEKTKGKIPLIRESGLQDPIALIPEPTSQLERLISHSLFYQLPETRVTPFYEIDFDFWFDRDEFIVNLFVFIMLLQCVNGRIVRSIALINSEHFTFATAFDKINARS